MNLIGRKVLQGCCFTAGPLDDETRNDLFCSYPEGDGEFNLREITAGGHHPAKLGSLPGLNCKCGPDCVAVGFAADQFEANPVIPRFLIIPQQACLFPVVEIRISRSPSASISA